MGFNLPPEDCKVEDKAEEDMFSQISAKSSVKIKMTTRGITWDIKVVTGEESQIDGLIQSAIKAHKDLILELAKEDAKA